MAKTPYMARISDGLLRQELESSGAVLIEGPKWCGKSRTAEQAAKSVIYMQDQDKAASYRMAAQTMPSVLLDGATPHLIDEWQDVPSIWDEVRAAIDASPNAVGAYILTGSSEPRKHEVHHSGAGRIKKLRMTTMTLALTGSN